MTSETRPNRGASLVGALLERRYRVDALVARGGMSTVYRGHDTRLDRPVALKVMDPRYSADPSFVQRFEREARAAARLHDSGVVAVYDQGVDRELDDDDHVYLVMELVRGGTLRDLIREYGRLPLALALSVLEPVLAALAIAHREGMVHRDIKPENVLIGQDGQVKVADFGLVRAVAAANASSGNIVLGTVAYLSPEQVTTGAASARTDVYAAGVVLYEMLTGEPPYTADTALSVAYRHVNDDVPPPSVQAPELPPAIDDLVVRATRRDESVRPSDAAAFLEAVQAARAELGIVTVPVPVPTLAHGVEPAGSVDDPPTEQFPAVAGTGAGGPQGTRAMSRAEAEQASGDRAGVGVPDRRRNRPALVWTLAVLALAALVGVGAWWLGSGRYVAVPRVNGLTEAAATQALRNAGLEPAITQDFDNTVPTGTVIRSDPTQGSQVARGNEVQLVVSQGRPKVPAVSPGLTAAEAERLLRNARLQPQLNPALNRFDDTVPANRVIGVSPGPGTRVTLGTPVTIILSKGPAPVAVPDVRGMTREQAFQALQSRGFQPFDAGVQFSSDVDGNHVIGTTPQPGTLVQVRDNPRIGVVVSNAVTVPEFLGSTVDAARQQAAALGLPLDVRQFVPRSTSQVFAQFPLAGSKVQPGTTVHLTAFP